MNEYRSTSFGAPAPQDPEEMTVQEAPITEAQVPAEETEEDPEDDDLYVVFKKPYKFEGQEYTGVDLHPLEDMTCADLKKCELRYNRTGGADPLKEFSLGYTMLVAASMTKKPIEFYNQLPARDALAVKAAVSNFLLGED